MIHPFVTFGLRKSSKHKKKDKSKKDESKQKDKDRKDPKDKDGKDKDGKDRKKPLQDESGESSDELPEPLNSTLAALVSGCATTAHFTIFHQDIIHLLGSGPFDCSFTVGAFSSGQAGWIGFAVLVVGWQFMF